MENRGPARVGNGDGRLTAWGFCDLAAGSSVLVAESVPSSSFLYDTPFRERVVIPGGDHLFTSGGELYNYRQQQQQQYLTCMKQGKRMYCGEDGVAKNEEATGTKLAAPRCQVEGCNKALVDAKDYHKRHKVCEMHSKAPSVVVLGVDQRFCQQCSRFHSISEFDDVKRSCRGRLAGHNERRRKSGNGNPSLASSTLAGSRFPSISNYPRAGDALSLLSTKAAINPWVSSTGELSSRSSAALGELIAENRAALFSKQLYSDRSSSSFQIPPQLIMNSNDYNHLKGSGITLDLLQLPTSSAAAAAAQFLQRSESNQEDDDDSCQIWESFQTPRDV